MIPTHSPALLIVLSAPSGGGKTTLCQHLVAARPTIARAITCTTRPPRAGEQNGIDYYFLEPEAFQQKLKAGEFLEHATVYGRSYGTLKSEVRNRLRQNQDVILSVDVQGVVNIQAAATADPVLKRALVTVFLAPPSIQLLEQRLRKRALDGETEIQKRLSLARQELAQARRFDYVIFSTEVPENMRSLLAIIDAEKLRQDRVAMPDYA